MIIKRSCDGCGVRYEAQSRRSKYCSTRCRMRASRAGASVTELRPASPAVGTVRATTGELGVLDALESVLGASALALAAQIDAGQTTGSALAALSRELRAVMEAARASAKPASRILSLLDRIEANRAGLG